MIRGDGAWARERTASLPAGPPDGWLTLPPGSTPRVLLTRDHLAADPGALRDVLGHTGRLRRTTTGIAASVLGAGAHRLLPDQPDWSDAAGRLLGLARRTSGCADGLGIIRVSPQRPNSKPVVQVVAADHSRTVAWVKIGWDDLSRPLVQHEGEVLASLETPDRLVVPDVLGREDGDVAALALRPLVDTPDERRAASPQDLARVALDVFGADGLGVGPELPVGELPVLVAETADLDVLAAGPLVDELRQRVERFRSTHGHRVVPTGRWHGDWNRANAARIGEQVVAWDWERSREGAPLGLDAAFVLMFLLPQDEARRELARLLPDHHPDHRRMLLALAALCAVSRHATLAALGVRTNWREALARLDAHL